MVLAKEKNKKSKGKTSKKSDFRITLYYGWSYSRRFGRNIDPTYDNLENLCNESNIF